MNVVSLFANIGIGEAYLKSIGFNVIVANELEPKRANIYKQIYPDTEVVCGDIRERKVIDEIIKEDNIFENTKKSIIKNLKDLLKIDKKTLVENRYQKYMKIGKGENYDFRK